MIKMQKEHAIYSKDEPEHFHLARLKKGGEKFEVIIDADKALEYINNGSVTIEEVLTSDKIYKDAKRCLAASEKTLQELFHTIDSYKIAEVILKDGEIQLTQEYRDKIREQKRKQIIEHIHRNGIDTRTDAPISIETIENALEQEKIKIEEHRTAEDQVKRIIKELQKVIPIKIEIKELDIKFNKKIAAKSLPFMKRISTVLKENWNNDGTLTCTVQTPAGLLNELVDQINSFAHGDVQIEIKK